MKNTPVSEILKDYYADIPSATICDTYHITEGQLTKLVTEDTFEEQTDARTERQKYMEAVRQKRNATKIAAVEEEARVRGEYSAMIAAKRVRKQAMTDKAVALYQEGATLWRIEEETGVRPPKLYQTLFERNIPRRSSM